MDTEVKREWISRVAAEKKFQLTRRQIEHGRRAGRIRHKKTGGRYTYCVEDLELLCEENPTKIDLEMQKLKLTNEKLQLSIDVANEDFRREAYEELIDGISALLNSVRQFCESELPQEKHKQLKDILDDCLIELTSVSDYATSGLSNE